MKIALNLHLKKFSMMKILFYEQNNTETDKHNITKKNNKLSDLRILET